MKILIDTHLLLWWMADSPQLTRQARQLMSSPDNVVFVSTVSLWELWLKESLGKLRLPAGFETQLAEEPFETLPLAAEHCRQVARLPWRHRDPFDRMLVAQAQVERLTLITADTHLAAYGEFVRAVS